MYSECHPPHCFRLTLLEKICFFKPLQKGGVAGELVCNLRIYLVAVGFSAPLLGQGIDNAVSTINMLILVRQAVLSNKCNFAERK